MKAKTVSFLILFLILSIAFFPTVNAQSTETLRPNAVGTYTQWTTVYPATTAHWAVVNETTSDNDDRYIASTTTDEAIQIDTFNIPSTGINPLDTINSVTVYINVRSTSTTASRKALFWTQVYSYSTLYSGSQNSPSTTYTVYSDTWTTNPNTNQPWTVTELNALEIGVKVQVKTANYPGRCTQVWVVIAYTPKTWAWYNSEVWRINAHTPDWFLSEVWRVNTHNYSWFLTEMWKTTLLPLSWNIAEIWLMELHNYSWFNVESWMLNLHNYSWFMSEIWQFALRSPSWFNVESWKINLHNFTWFLGEAWNIYLPLKSWFLSEIWRMSFRNSAWSIAEIWRLNLFAGTGEWFFAELWQLISIYGISHSNDIISNNRSPLIYVAIGIAVICLCVGVGVEEKRRR